jgi:hypothetical protein
MSTSRVNDRTASPDGSSSGTGSTRSATTDSSTTGPPACCQRRNQVSTSSSDGALSRLSGTAASCCLRPRSSREIPPLPSSHDGAHQATTWDWARVSAT